MARITGLFNFRLKVRGEERSVIVEILRPGIDSYRVVHAVRGEWAVLMAPGISQNRIECLGWKQVESVPGQIKRARAIGPHPLIFFRAEND